MIKQKAPKDMTATEFVEHLELVASREMLAKNTEGWAITLQGIRRELSEPAPNPFTPDQLAWMRIMQEMGFRYAVADKNGCVCLTDTKPTRASGCWLVSHLRYNWFGKGLFLSAYISFYDSEPLCFADYAPLEEK